MTTLHRIKETKSRSPIYHDHPMVRAARAVLATHGGRMSSRDIFLAARRLGLVGANQYNSLRARLSQHCDLPGAVVVRSFGSSRQHGSPKTWWVLAANTSAAQRTA